MQMTLVLESFRTQKSKLLNTDVHNKSCRLCLHGFQSVNVTNRFRTPNCLQYYSLLSRSNQTLIPGTKVQFPVTVCIPSAHLFQHMFNLNFRFPGMQFEPKMLSHEYQQMKQTDISNLYQCNLIYQITSKQILYHTYHHQVFFSPIKTYKHCIKSMAAAYNIILFATENDVRISISDEISNLIILKIKRH